MIRTQISMTDEQAEALRRLSAVRQRSQAALMRDALDALVAEEDRARRIELARAVVGGFRSGGADAAERHDEALDEAFGS